MRQRPSWYPPLSQAIALLALSVGLSGCSGTPQESTSSQQVPAQQVTPQGQQGIDLRLPPSEYSAQFSSAEQALDRFDWMSASVALDTLTDSQQALSMDDASYSNYLRGRIAYVRGQQQLALRGLEMLEAPGTNPALQYRARDLRRQALALAGSNLESARLADLMLRSAPPAHHDALRRDIWVNLQRADDTQLQQAMNATTDLQWHGWLELASIARSGAPGNTTDLVTWRSNNAQHPAATDMPGGLQFLMESPPAQIQRVALMLPLSERLGPAGKAVLDGYMASYYAARSYGGARHDVTVLDLDRYPSAGAAYQDALTQGANLVVGPLSKEAVAELASLAERPVPVLALNRAEQALPATGSPLVQMSLAPEDEATRIAELAFGRGARRALIIRPAGPWGSKMEQALRQRWAALGGSIASSETYNGRDEYSSGVKAGLGINNSERRARNIRDMLATNTEFTARRRQDVDAIFLLSSNGPQARSIKPLLAFHYAGALPIYATSSIYSGLPDPRDKDLSGINLVETPWLLGASSGLRVAIAAGGTDSDNYTRLNALGADAYLLQSRFMQLQAGPDVALRGNTGLLSIDAQSRLHRELSLATFDGSELRAQ